MWVFYMERVHFMDILLSIGVAMFAGLFLTRLTSKFNLPDVTSYLVAGLLVGPLVLGRLGVPGLGFVSFEFVETMSLISDIALGFIAFSIGSEFRLEELKHIGRKATVIAIFQAFTATLFVDGALGQKMFQLLQFVIAAALQKAARRIRHHRQAVASGGRTLQQKPVNLPVDARNRVLNMSQTGEKVVKEKSSRFF